MSEWKNFSLGDLCSRLSSGKNIKSKEIHNVGLYPVYGGNGIRGYTENYNFTGECAIIGRQGAYCGNVRFFSGKAYMTEHAVVVCGNELCDTRFLAYKLSKMNLGRLSSQSAQPGLSVKTLGIQNLSIPPLATQKKIAAVLSALDDKIELNIAINKNLEEQAQAIYKNMFVDNFNPAWKSETLSDIAEITMGQSPNGKSYNDSGKGMIFFQGRTDFGFRFPTIRMFTTEPKRIAKKGDVLFSVRAPVGDYNVAVDNCCIGRGLAALSAKNSYQSFLFYTMFHLKQQIDIYNGQGTVFGAINQQELKRIKIVIPEQSLINEFEKIVAPMDSNILNNHFENQKLGELRDALLPRLMSGEIDVSAVDI